jgi:anti-sigma regulatory factor (Ser/Thr protein kinase)
MGLQQSAPSLGRAWCVDLRVPPVPEAVGRVRDAVVDLGLPAALVDDARLLVSELVTNSIRHAGLRPDDWVRVRADWSGHRLRVDVLDDQDASEGSGLAGGIRPDPSGESGWGLYLVDAIASRWGRAPGRHWFELELDT